MGKSCSRIAACALPGRAPLQPRDMQLSPATRAALAKYLPPCLIEDIAAITISVVDHGTTKRLTRATAHADATEIADLAAKLKRKLLGSQLTPALGMVDLIVNGRPGIDASTIERLVLDLSSVRAAALAVCGVTDNPMEKAAGLIWNLPSAGARSSQAQPIVSVVMWALCRSGVALTGSENSIATRCVAMVLQDAGIDADARHQVREWLKNHPPAANGGRYVGTPNSKE